jgi:glyoxylate reductase
MISRALVTQKIAQEGINILRQGKLSITVYRGTRPMPYRLLKRFIPRFDGLLCMLCDRIDKEVLQSATRLRVISTMSAGYDHIDLKTAEERGILVTNTPGVLTEATAELTWALILACARRVPEGDRLIREGKFKGWRTDLLLGTELCGKTLGIIGAGRIGQAVGRISQGFRMRLLYTSNRRKPGFERDLGAKFVGLDKLLKESDFVSINCSLTPQTKNLIGARQLRMMKRGAFLINTSRGQVVDESALVRAVKRGWIAGAGIDVYEREPKIHPELVKLDRVVLLPHVGSATHSTRTAMAKIAAKNLVLGLQGKMPLFPVDIRG